MKIENRKLDVFVNIILIIFIFSIPLYSVRMSCCNTSLSVLTIAMILTIITLGVRYYKEIVNIFKQGFAPWLFSLLFITSFIPALIAYPTVHGFGVFIEWILLPAVTGFFLINYLKNDEKNLLNLNIFLTLLLLGVSVVSLIYFFAGHITFDNRLSGFFDSPNQLALFIAPLICIAATTIYTANTRFKAGGFLAITTSLIVLFLTNSLGTIIGIIGAGLIAAFIKYRRTTVLLSVFIVSIIFLGITLYHKISYSNPDMSRNSFAARTQIWTVTANHLQQNILFNTTGIDSFQEVYLDAQPFYSPYLHWDAPTPHNLLATLWFNGGFFAVLFFCLVCVWWIYTTISLYNKTKNAAILFYIAAFVSILLSGFFDAPYWKNDLAIIFWLVVIYPIGNPDYS